MGKLLVVALVALAPMASGVIGHAASLRASAPGSPMPGHSAAQSTRTALAVASPEIDILNFQFAAPTLTVPVGTTVTWVNQDDEPHTVTSATRLFSSPGLDTGESFSFRFAARGTYTYFCALHPHMTAKIVVK